MALKFSDKCFWAKEAARLNLDTAKGQRVFYDISKTSSLGERRLSYYSNAFEAAGESGMKALTYRKRMPDRIREKATEKINRYLRNRVPPKLRSEIGFLVRAQYNRITISEKRPLFSDPSQTSCIEIIQVRYTDFDNRWHLYWMRKFNKWWPYVPRELVHSIDDCIREIKEDGWGCFWG